MKSLIKILVVVVLVFCSCKNSQNVSKTTNNGKNESTRTQQEELDFVRDKALSFKKNPQGYWEATFENNVTMIHIPAGSFIMGNSELSPDVVTEAMHATPEHKVNLSGYWIGKTPTTIGQFRVFVKETKYVTDVEKPGHQGPFVYIFKEREFAPTLEYYWDNAFKDVLAKYPELTISDKHPVVAISWNDAITYCNWLSKKIGLQFSLPTEAEWEYAARGSDGRVYPWGNEAPNGTRANYADEEFDKYFPGTEQSLVHHGVNDGYAITSPVGSFPNGVSPFGALDMAGNVTEWVYDSPYDYDNREVTDPIYTKVVNRGNRTIKLMKAGFWAGSAGRPGEMPDELVFGHNIRADSRQGDDLNSADDHLGFRIAISYTERN